MDIINNKSKEIHSILLLQIHPMRLQAPNWYTSLLFQLQAYYCKIKKIPRVTIPTAWENVHLHVISLNFNTLNNSSK